MSALLLDIGNTRVKWGVLLDGNINQTGNTPLQDFPPQLPKQIDSAIACNVAGTDIAGKVAAAVESQCNAKTTFVQSTMSAAGVTNSYKHAASLGVDRWVALIGARAATDKACIVVDAGTAITIDALDANGQHLGGQILPGLRLMAEALDLSTSDLPDVSGRLTDRVSGEPYFANATVDAIAAGILSAANGAIENAMRALQAEERDADLLLTGGDAPLLKQVLARASELREHLVLEGLARLLAS